MPSAEKRSFAHFEIDSSGSPEETDRATDALAATLASLAGEVGEPGGAPLERLVGGLVHGADAGPRGLSPALLLSEAAAAGGLEMEALARRLVPPARGAWYRAADAAPPDAPACRLGVALAAWGWCRRGRDPDFVAAAAASVARLTHADPGSRTDACLVALVALERAVAATSEPEPLALAVRFAPLAARFGGAAPSGRLDAVWASLERFPSDVAEARARCTRLGGDGPTAAALAGLGAAVPDGAAAAWRSALAVIHPRSLSPHRTARSRPQALAGYRRAS